VSRGAGAAGVWDAHGGLKQNHATNAGAVDLPIGGLVAGLIALALMPAIAALARRKIGGHTGDILGAGQQVAEIALLMAISAAANWRGPL
jgi:cobalamin synthase